MKTRIFLSALVASSVLASPVLSQERKTFFDVLFPKAYERKIETRKRAQEAQEQAQQALKKKLPKVRTSRNYAYKVQKRSLIKLSPIPVVMAVNEAVNTNEVTGSISTVAAPTLTGMTRDITLANELKFSTETHLADAISEFYAENQKYYWLNEDGSWNNSAKSVLKVLKKANKFGLDPADYTVEVQELEVLVDDSSKAKARLSMEISMTNALLRYSMDASFGTINPNRLSGYHDFPVHYAQSADILETVMTAPWPAYKASKMHPSNDKFLALKGELDSLQTASDDLIELKTNILLRPGQSNDELPNIISAVQKRASAELLEKHSVTLDAYASDTTYTKELSALVKDYQKEAGLGPDGVIGKNTLSKLAGIPSSSKIDRIRISMERMRWLPHELGERHVFINQPEYRARYIEEGAEKLSMRVVVGKKSNQTNFFYDEIEHIEYNPYWNVPRSIIVNEFLPKSIGNPGYLDSRGYQVRTWGGQSLSSSSVNWSEMGANPKIAVRQPPGPKNALGELKIMFPNKHAIYMHDTPAKSLFKKQHRAFSHGCVRLHDPRAMAAAVMGSSKKQIANRIAQGKNLTEKLPNKVPVYVAYFTAWPQEDGTVKYFADMYGRDAHILKAMNATRKARALDIAS